MNRIAKPIFAVSLVAALTVGMSTARAQERAGDAALGALSGAVVLGPIGAVAGAVVGYTSGPSIAHSWGLRRSGAAPARQAKTAVRDSKPKAVQPAQPATPGVKPSGAPSSSVPAPVRSAGGTGATPPVQALE